MRITIIIKLSNDLELEIEGYYDKGQIATYNYPIENSLDNIASDFDIQNVKIIKGNLIEFIKVLNNHQWQEMQKIRENPNKFIVTEDIWGYLTELTIKRIEENE